MLLKEYKHQEIGKRIGVSSGFISEWTRQYEQLGMNGLRLRYSGSVGSLEPEQRQSVIALAIKGKSYRNLAELQADIEQEYEVVFDSKQRYYTLFEQAGISWKKTQKCNPKVDPKLVKKPGDYDLVGNALTQDRCCNISRCMAADGRKISVKRRRLAD